MVLEGPDGSGKTTFAKSLKHLEYVHFGPPPKGRLGAWHQYHKLLEDLWDNPRPGGVVIDRFIHGELIYGPILRGKTDLTWAHIRMLERVLMGLSANLVICLPPWETVFKNWERNKEHELIKHEDELWYTYQFYTGLLGDKSAMLPRRCYNYTDIPNLPDGWHEPYHFPNQGPGIGLFMEGNTLLIGDEVNHRRGKDGWPFVSPDSSSLWLAQQLEQAKIPEYKLYWINAITRGGWTNPSFIDKLRPEKIVAMGGKAQKWCILNKIDFIPVAHPQWHKRFRAAEPYPLIDILR